MAVADIGTPPSGLHLAQLNIGRLHAPLDDPRTQGFVSRLVEVNALAERSPGFVWRLQTEAGDATGICVDVSDPLLIVNMSVWESVETLRDFVYRTAHLDVLRQRRDWFERMSEAYAVLWWIPAGTIPTLDESFARLHDLRSHGPSARAFTLRSPEATPR